MAGDGEPFPPLTSATATANSNADASGARRRRKSSVLGSDIRAGDTGAPAMATSRASLKATEASNGNANGQVRSVGIKLINRSINQSIKQALVSFTVSSILKPNLPSINLCFPDSRHFFFPFLPCPYANLLS